MYKVYREGGSLVYPLFFDYPEDDKVFDVSEETYMLGDAIKVSPVLDKGVNDTFKSYFP
jgi:alpha-glucosidase (family GH31 glycosyl hydrolase)